MLNTIQATGQLRQPRGLVRVFNSADAALAASLSASPTGALTPTPLTGWTEFSVTNNAYLEADTFRVEFAASALPSDFDAGWFSNLSADTFIEIFAGVPADPAAPKTDELQSLIYGRVDDIEYDPTNATVTLTGRDLTGAFIDKKGTAQYVNQRAFQIVEQLAQSHGLTCLATVTNGFVGTFDGIQYTLLQSTQSEWDLISRLARDEGFVVYVQGQSMYFGPDQRFLTDAYEIQWTPPKNGEPPNANAVSLAFSRNMTVAKSISVEVSSTNLHGNTPFKQSYPAAPRSIAPGKASPFGPETVYRFTLSPGHSATDCQKYAQSMYERIASHAMKVHGELPADDLLSVQVHLAVSGTKTGWDQIYEVMSVTRTMSMEDGYYMSFEAQNTTPELEQDAEAA